MVRVPVSASSGEDQWSKTSVAFSSSLAGEDGSVIDGSSGGGVRSFL